MTKVLIDTRKNSIHDIVADGSEFPVAGDLKWVEGPSESVSQRTHVYDGSVFSEKPARVVSLRLVDPSPGALDIMAMLIELGVKKRNGKPLTQADLPNEWQDLMAP